MSAPRRIQRKRAKGWRMPEGAVYVGRGSEWGNPLRVVELGPGLWAVEAGVSGFRLGRFHTKTDALSAAAKGYPLYMPEAVSVLAGKDLACWCPIDQPCHADVLLEFANKPQEDA